MWLLSLIGCPAEMLGIPVPQSGVDAIAMDDLVRDVAKLSHGATAADDDLRLAFLDERWRQMGLVPEPGSRCARARPSPSPAAVLVVADEWKTGDVASFAPAAVAISIAKAFHEAPIDVAFCVGVERPAAQTLRVHPLGRSTPRLRAPAPLPGATVTPDLDAATLDEAPTATSSDLDYRSLEAAARLAVPAVEALAGAAPR
jgi:hypothetical protein